MTINKKNEIDEDHLSELSIETSSFFSLSLSLSLCISWVITENMNFLEWVAIKTFDSSCYRQSDD
jgi:hypothetical protein